MQGAPSTVKPAAGELEGQFEHHRRELTALLLPDARVAVRGRGRRPGDVRPRLARLRPLRGALGAALVALPHRDERLPRHARAAGSGAPGRWTSGRRGEPVVANLHALPEVTWIEPMPDALVVAAEGDPAEVDGRARDDPARVRRRAPAPAAAAARGPDPLRGAALAGDARSAELLETTVASVNSALQRARATLEASDAHGRGDPAPELDEADARAPRALRRRVRALRHGRAHVADPRGRDAVDAAVRPLARAAATTSSRGGSGPGIGCRGSRVIPTVSANGSPAFGQYKPSETGDGYEPVGAPGARDRGRADRRADLLPRHGAAVPALRPAARLDA